MNEWMENWDVSRLLLDHDDGVGCVYEWLYDGGGWKDRRYYLDAKRTNPCKSRGIASAIGLGSICLTRASFYAISQIEREGGGTCQHCSGSWSLTKNSFCIGKSSEHFMSGIRLGR